jgi:hypothetical protein
MKQLIKYYYKQVLPLSFRNKVTSVFNTLSGSKKQDAERFEALYNEIFEYFKDNGSHEFAQELEFIKSKRCLVEIPYKRTPVETPQVITGNDKANSLPFVLHNGKKLYFPKSFSENDAKQAYLNVVVDENIIGGGFLEKTPHQYTTNEFFVKNGDVIFDVGAAEGLFMLDNVEKVSKGFIFEADPSWIEALKATFEPYKDKITLINKFAADYNSSTTQMLDSCDITGANSIFIKMDVEGFELKALEGAKNRIHSNADIRIACCTYHKQNDVAILTQYLRDRGYYIELSEGYMLFFRDNTIKPPYFRKGLIRAKNIF